MSEILLRLTADINTRRSASRCQEYASPFRISRLILILRLRRFDRRSFSLYT